MNKKSLGKMMSEFSDELGITNSKKSNGMGRRMLMMAGGIAGFTMLRRIMKSMMK